MTLVLLQAMIQSISSTLHWVGLYVGIRALPGDRWRQRRWAIGSAIVFTAWLVGVMLLAANGFFRFAVWPRGIPAALAMTLKHDEFRFGSLSSGSSWRILRAYRR
jgi:hypothetical protein